MRNAVLRELARHVSPHARTAWVDLEVALPQVAHSLGMSIEQVKEAIVAAAYAPSPPVRLVRGEQFGENGIVIGGIRYRYALLKRTEEESADNRHRRAAWRRLRSWATRVWEESLPYRLPWLQRDRRS